MSEAEDCPPHPKHWIRLTHCDSESSGLRSAASDHRLALRGEIGPASHSIRGTLPADGWSKTQSAERAPNESGQDGPSAGDRCQMTRSVAGNQPSQVLVRYWAPTSGDDWFVRGLPVGAAGRANSRLASLKTNRAS